MRRQVRILRSIAWNEQYTVVGFISKVTHVSLDIDVEIKSKTDVFLRLRP